MRQMERKGMNRILDNRSLHKVSLYVLSQHNRQYKTAVFFVVLGNNCAEMYLAGLIFIKDNIAINIYK